MNKTNHANTSTGRTREEAFEHARGAIEYHRAERGRNARLVDRYDFVVA